MHRRFNLYGFMLLLPISLLPTAVSAKCGCPDDGNGAPVAATGLGQMFPDASDLAPDPVWKVYEFEREGIRYVQINDGTGAVRAAVGRIGDTFWTMPIGSDADRASLPGATLHVGTVQVLYRSADTEVLRYQDGSVTRWVVRSL